MEEGREKVCVCVCVNVLAWNHQSTPFCASDERHARIFLNSFLPPISL